MRHAYLLLIGLLVNTIPGFAQSQTIPLNTDYYHLIDRLEVKQGRWADNFHSSVKPYNRHQVVQMTDSLLEDPYTRLSPVDRFNVQYLRDDSWEWLTPRPSHDSLSATQIQLSKLGPNYNPIGNSRRPFLGVFYRKKSDFFHAGNAYFDVHMSPVINFNGGFENLNVITEGRGRAERQRPYVNSRGVEIRGSVLKRLSFYTFFSENQALYSRNIQDYTTNYVVSTDEAIAPSEGMAKQFGRQPGGVDFLSARGYITFNALKVINLQFGHDRNFVGNGFRSLFLSDNSAPYTFLRITTRLGPFQYTNLYSELQNRQRPVSANEPLPRKYATMHHLSVNIGKHVNVGIFEAVIFGRDQLELNYLNPVILYRYIEGFRNSADNALLGLDWKVNFLGKFLWYNQLLIDEFRISDWRARNGAWTQKTAFQTGIKYVDAFGIPNLDVQGEFNVVRPFTYAHRTSNTNYVNYSQPLAHPLGANFREGLAIVRYQPIPRLNLTGILGVLRFGVDPPGRNYGGNLLKSYETRFRNEGNFVAQGRETLVSYGDLRATYMLKHNFFLDFRQMLRLSDSQASRLDYSSSMTSFGVRWNMAYRNLVL